MHGRGGADGPRRGRRHRGAGGAAGEPADRQSAAADAASARALTVVVGGPGTGKTHTIARLLAELLTDEPTPASVSPPPPARPPPACRVDPRGGRRAGTWPHDVAAALGRRWRQ